MRHLLSSSAMALLAIVALVDVRTFGAIVAGLTATVLVTALVAPYTARTERRAA